MKKRITARLLAPALVLCLLLTAMLMNVSAASAEEQLITAKALNVLHLFQGYDTTGSNFGLTDAVTREQALIFQIRVLGEEAAAKAYTGKSTYSDIAADNWFLPYAAYATEKGYTKGMGDGSFGMGQPATAQMMTTFILRGMGYSDSAATPDFTYDTALAYGLKLGICEEGLSGFTRGDAVIILGNAFGSNCKDGELLSVKLAKKGVFTQAEAENATAILSGKPTAPTVPTTPPDLEENERTVLVNFVNQTKLTMKELYFTASGDDSWGTTNLLKVAADGSLTLELQASNSFYLFDLQFVDDKGTEYELYELDLSKADKTATYQLNLTEGGELAVTPVN